VTDGLVVSQAALLLYDGWSLIERELIYYFEQTVNIDGSRDQFRVEAEILYWCIHTGHSYRQYNN
jgi:hypothetical protein